MKKGFFIVTLLLAAVSGQAQIFEGEAILNRENIDKQRWSWGYFLGFNTYDLDFDYIGENDQAFHDDFIVNKSIGFNVGLIGNLRLSEHLDLRLEPGVAFNTINLEFSEDPIEVREVNSTFVHIPLLLKVSTKRLNNFKPFLVGGISTSINLSSNQDNPSDNLDGQFRMTTNSYYYEIGFGVDLYMYYFKFTPSIRGIFAINDNLVRDEDPMSPFTSNISRMSTRGVFINFTFQ